MPKARSKNPNRPARTAPPKQKRPPKKRGNKGDFHGSRLAYLNSRLTAYNLAGTKVSFPDFWLETMRGYWSRFPWYIPITEEPPAEIPDEDISNMSADELVDRAKIMTALEEVSRLMFATCLPHGHERVPVRNSNVGSAIVPLQTDVLTRTPGLTYSQNTTLRSLGILLSYDQLGRSISHDARRTSTLSLPTGFQTSQAGRASRSETALLAIGTKTTCLLYGISVLKKQNGCTRRKWTHGSCLNSKLSQARSHRKREYAFFIFSKLSNGSPVLEKTSPKFYSP